ncbi:hypothetical protein ACXIUS_26960 [Bosea thiooxidans]
MTEHSDLTSVIAWLEAGCDPAEAAKELRSYQAALSSQSPLRAVLRECQSALAMMIAPDAIKQTTVINAYATAVAAEAKARSALENVPAGLASERPNFVRETFAYYTASAENGLCKVPRRVADDMLQSYKALEDRVSVLADATSNPSSPHCGKGVAAGPAVSEGDRSHSAPVTSGAEVVITRDMITAAEIELVSVLRGFDYFMPADGMERVLKAALVSGSREDKP